MPAKVTSRFGKLGERFPRATRFVRARLARGEYLGLHLTIGFIISVLGLVIFSVITHAVIQKAALTQLDVRVHEWLHAHATIAGYGGWSVLSALGGGPALTTLGIGVGVLLWLRKRKIVFAGWAAAFIGGGLLDGALKIVIRRERPETAFDFLDVHSWSFPSGHSMGSFIAYGMLAYLLVLEFPNHRKLQIAIVAAIALFVASIGLSRMYLGVHYFSDVMGGFAAGALWLSACISALEVVRRLRLKKHHPVAPEAPAHPA